MYLWPRQNAAGHNQLEKQLSLPTGSNRIQSLTQSQNIEGQASTIERNFEWDTAGQLLSDGDKQHQYNPQGRKASSQAPEPSGTGSQTLHTHYLYNGHSQRVRKASPLGHTDYSYGPAELGMSHWPLGIYRSSGSTQASTEILYLPTAQGPMPVAAEIDGQLYAIEADHLHTPRRLSNAQGQGVWQWITSGFGEVPASHAGNGFVLEGEGSSSGPNLGPSIDFALRYPGQVHDLETGLHYNHHRYYDPHLTVGYTQADPIGLDGGWNRFGYVGGNPLSMVDWGGLANSGWRPRLTPYSEWKKPTPVMICFRPVDINGLSWIRNYIPHHAWIKTPRLEAGMGGECDMPGQQCSDKLYGQTVVKDHSRQSGFDDAMCIPTSPNIDVDCVERKILADQPTGRWTIFNQCQSFAYGVIDSCRR